MKKLSIEKAGNTPGRPPVEDVFISIHSSGVFEETAISSASICQGDAEDLHEALHDSLPQATFNRLAALMLRTLAGAMIRTFEPEEEARHKSISLTAEQFDFLVKAAQMKEGYECAEYSPEEKTAVYRLIRKLESKA